MFCSINEIRIISMSYMTYHCGSWMEVQFQGIIMLFICKYMEADRLTLLTMLQYSEKEI